MKPSKLRLGYWTLTILASFAAASAGFSQVILLDDDMQSAYYDSFSFNSSDYGANVDDISSVSNNVVVSGGNPGSYLQVLHTLEVMENAPNGAVSLQSILDDQNFTYTPSISGAIQSLSFSIDIRTSDPFSSVGFVVNDQEGGQLAGFTSFDTDGNWQTVTFEGLLQSDFDSRDFSGSLPLSFGFSLLSNGYLMDDGNGNYESQFHTADVDNFRVTAILVPEPSSLALFGLMTCGLMFCRSRR